jgi:hypothetical protein
MVPNNMDALEWLRKHLDAEGSDLLREMVRGFAERLMAAEVDVVSNAGYGEITQERINSRSGYQPRQLDTRVGSIDLLIPTLCEGSCYPGWLLEPRRRAERALVAVVAECYVRSVSTRRVEGPGAHPGDRAAGCRSPSPRTPHRYQHRRRRVSGTRRRTAGRSPYPAFVEGARYARLFRCA